MPINCLIGIERDKHIDYIICLNYGEFDSVGTELFTKYNSRDLVNSLINKGHRYLITDVNGIDSFKGNWYSVKNRKQLMSKTNLYLFNNFYLFTKKDKWMMYYGNRWRNFKIFNSKIERCDIKYESSSYLAN